MVGIGFLGAVLVGLASNAGAEVTAFSRSGFALEQARLMGANTCIQVSNTRQTAADGQAVSRGNGFDRVIEATGYQEPLDLASSLCAVRGRLIIAGYHQDGPRTVDMQHWNWRGMDVINAHERDPAVYRRGVLEAANAIIEGRLDPRPLYGESYSLSQLGSALGDLTGNALRRGKPIVLIN